MATIEKRVGRRSVSYRITVSDGYDGNYKKIRRRKTWRVPEGWSEKRAEKEVQKIALEFKQKIRQGYEIDNRKTFGEYAEYVIGVKERAGVKHNTILSYQYLLRGVREKIGNMKLVDIRPFHLNELYRSLQEKGLRCTESKVHIAMDLGAFLKEHKISRASLSREAGVSHTTVTSACRGNKIFRQQAEKMAKALGKRVEELFVADERTVKLAPKTIREYARTGRAGDDCAIQRGGQGYAAEASTYHCKLLSARCTGGNSAGAGGRADEVARHYAPVDRYRLSSGRDYGSALEQSGLGESAHQDR